ncbi:hypothetical protein PC129_g20570 [Phytophthora cactorum]|uniref:Peptidase A1 domain-containing protein n=1 Tax=Phytophthora cactorum TaxID=29920 RepID=A0A329RG47_9STRA|nr:hypothetical protein Pcac1_g27624 [Phytophthora cactorum]KAG2796506.1 hypothetical protein PC111_g21693 [Phytophthora cactorum]KAG2798702.1 hypothetical protein PC112_g21234 [Phytophthora cactorum]KAG2838092.1 hypothetical protein PC113_g19720 [Phytophthora cactorum]KAG2877706.1 hypothetical protein PC114_g23495 [Phytophthora cactorum]
MDRCKRILRCLVLVLLLRQGLSSANQHHFVRIPLETSDQLRFTGVLHLGSPPRGVRVVFDTGSSDTWVFSINAAIGDEGQASRTFTVGYGGGIVSGVAAPTDLQLGSGLADELLLRNVPVGFADDHTLVIPGLDAQGVVGLGMEALAQIHSNSSVPGLLAQQPERISPLVFSLYISSWAQAQPASQLIIGGDDPALPTANTTWFSFPVVSHNALHSLQSSSQSSKDSYGFWALRVHNLSFGNATLSFGNPNRNAGVALLDSGTSVLLLSKYTIESIVRVLSAGFGTRLLSPSNDKRALPVCRPCQAHEFPPLAFDFAMDDSTISQRFELQGSDYVRCNQRHRECTAMIDAFDPSEVSDHLDDVVILGTVFFRAFYARFDYSNKQVSLACSLDDHAVCRGGLQPALDYQGHVYEPYSDVQQPRRSWTGICAALTALALFAGLRTLLQPY